MLAARQGRLPNMIISLLDYGEDPSGFRAGKSLLMNLKKLLEFWQEHYLHKDKDCSTLEKSSLIAFAFWKATVDKLVSNDASSPTSILHYIQESGSSQFYRPFSEPTSFFMDTDEPFWGRMENLHT